MFFNKGMCLLLRSASLKIIEPIIIIISKWFLDMDEKSAYNETSFISIENWK